MRRFVLAVLLIAALAIVPNQPATASIALSHELTFTLPVLTGPIHDIDFYDIDGDHVPEVLAADSSHVVLYSISGDSVIFQTAFDTTTYAIRVLLDDITRDGFADIAVSGCVIADVYLSGAAMVLTVYDGATTFADSTRLVFDVGDFPSGYGGYLGGYMGTADADGDNEREFVFSYSIHHEYSWAWSLTIDGTTMIYERFPDSALEIPGCIMDIAPFATTDSLTGFLASTYTYEVEGIGPDQTTDVVSTGIWSADGLSRSIPSSACLEWGQTTDYYNMGCIAYSLCMGRILGDSASAGAVTAYRFNQYDGSGDTYYTGLQMDRIISSDSTELVWTLEVCSELWNNDRINNLVYLPGYEGYFFGFYNHNDGSDEFIQFVGEDGSVNQATDDVPPGTLSWKEPYDDGQPLLIAINGTEIAFYRPDIVTGIFESPEETILPESFVLGQPYPNPFNPTMSVPVTLNQPGHLTVEIYNPLGQRVAMLCDKSIPAGTQRFDWNAAGFGSGVYMVKATLGDHTETVKAVLVK